MYLPFENSIRFTHASWRRFCSSSPKGFRSSPLGLDRQAKPDIRFRQTSQEKMRGFQSMERKNFRVSVTEKYIPYGIRRAFDQYSLGVMSLDEYIRATNYLYQLYGMN
jgi:hypothetical protein